MQIYFFVVAFQGKKTPKGLVFCSKYLAVSCRCLVLKMFGQNTNNLVYRSQCCPVSCVLLRCGTIPLQHPTSAVNLFWGFFFAFLYCVTLHKTFKCVLASYFSCLPKQLQDISFKIAYRHITFHLPEGEEDRKLNFKGQHCQSFLISIKMPDNDIISTVCSCALWRELRCMMEMLQEND